jgi:hypothetical protein
MAGKKSKRREVNGIDGGIVELEIHEGIITVAVRLPNPTYNSIFGPPDSYRTDISADSAKEIIAVLRMFVRNCRKSIEA